MKIKMKTYHTGGKKDLAPGDIASFDDAEAKRLIEIGAAEAVDEPDDEPRGKKI